MNRLIYTATALAATACLAIQPAWAYKALQSVISPPVAENPPVQIDGVTSSLQDEFQGPNVIWDTTIVLRNVGSQPVESLELEVSMADVQGIILTRVLCPLTVKLAPGAGRTQRLRELHLGWPGAITAASVRSVVLAGGSRWPVAQSPAKPPTPDATPLPQPSVPALEMAKTPGCR